MYFYESAVRCVCSRYFERPFYYGNDSFSSPFLYFNFWNPYPLYSSSLKRVLLSGGASLYSPLQGVTTRPWSFRLRVLLWGHQSTLVKTFPITETSTRTIRVKWFTLLFEGGSQMRILMRIFIDWYVCYNTGRGFAGLILWPYHAVIHSVDCIVWVRTTKENIHWKHDSGRGRIKVTRVLVVPFRG